MCNCGHPRPLLCDRNDCTTLQLGMHDILLGVEPFEPTEICHTFLPGERLVIYTDGIADAADGEHTPFGDERICRVVCERAKSSPQQCADAVMEAVDEFRRGAPQMDDETIVVIDRV